MEAVLALAGCCPSASRGALQNSDRLQVSSSLNYSDASHQALQKGNVLAERLLGWQQISPLESLAGARPEDSLLVALEGATWDGQRLTVTHQPVEIAGPDKALITVDRVEGKKLLGHYPSGKKVVVQSQPRVKRLDLERLQGQPLWIYGTRYRRKNLRPRPYCRRAYSVLVPTRPIPAWLNANAPCESKFGKTPRIE